MRLAFLGTPDFAVPTLAALAQAGHEIAAVYSQPPAPRGRGQAVRPSPVQAFAIANGLKTFTPTSLRDAQQAAAFRALDLDAAIVVAFGQILSPEILAAPRLGAYNLHASLLPRWRGAAPIQRAIMAGDAITGVQVMRMAEGLDEGPILASHSTRIDALDTAGDLHDRLSLAGADLMVEALGALERGEARLTPQAEDGAIYARKIKADEARIRWDRPAARIDRQVRGLSPFPGAWFTLPGDKGEVRIKALLSRPEEGEGPPGTALDDALLIACGREAVRLLRVQREGKAPAAAEAFLRGRPVPAGTVLG
jgi:methionyl-tRNA formyltransferase